MSRVRSKRLSTRPQKQAPTLRRSSAIPSEQQQLAVDYLRSRNIGQFAMDIDFSDWRVRSSNSVIKKVMSVSKRGAVSS